MNAPIILLAEDNPDDEELTRLAFEQAGQPHRLVIVRDGAEALDWLFAAGAFAGRTPAEPPDLVLLDLKLPKVDGLEVLRRLRADPRTALTPVIILTTSLEEPDLANAYRHGANSYIRKPVDFDQFTEALRVLGHYWLKLNQAPPRARKDP
jgi:two-component system, response regulator